MNDFKIDLSYSLEENDNDMFDNLYRKVFYNLNKIEIVSDFPRQKQGIDKVIHLNNGKQLTIDEKKRRKDYGDILLEEYSDFDNKKWGWLSRVKHTDYIVYAIMPSKTAYFLPFILLQLAWIKNYRCWLDLYGRKFALNNGYKTSNIPIPKNILFNAIQEQMTMSFE